MLPSASATLRCPESRCFQACGAEMVRTYLPKTNLFGLDAKRSETYFGMKAEGAEEPGGGELPPPIYSQMYVLTLLG